MTTAERRQVAWCPYCPPSTARPAANLLVDDCGAPACQARSIAAEVAADRRCEAADDV